MLRGISTVNLWADDLPAATSWYTELLGVEPYFTSEAAGRGPGYVEFRIGDYQHELGIIDRRFAPPGLAAGPGGAVVYWHVDDVARNPGPAGLAGRQATRGAHRARPRVRHRLGGRPLRQRPGHHAQPPLPRHPGQPRMSAVGAPLRP
jgi:catechol 2,3-dioxygenase-like lactoylglutathione lyase family enzyme